jgi:small-conductance mechanosensitive channel
MDFSTELTYPIIITAIFILVYLYFRIKVLKVERNNIKSINKRDINDAVETDSPVENSEKELKSKGIEGLEDRFSFINKIVPITLVFLWAISVSIPQIGKIPSVYVSIIAAIVSVLAGLALRPFLENLFSGIVISFFRSVRVGDTVTIEDHYGVIEEIGLTNTILKRWDWNRIIIPNSRLLQKEIQNMTITDHFIWANVEFYVSPEAPIEKIEQIAINSAKNSQYFNKMEEPSFWVMDLEKDSVKCWVAAWADTPADAWGLKNDMRTQIIKELQKEKVSFHIHKFTNIS